MEWFDPNFNPLQELRQCQSDIRQIHVNSLELVRAHNMQEGFLSDLVNQHNNLVEMIKQLKIDVEKLQQRDKTNQ
jgi:hypothetical protein